MLKPADSGGQRGVFRVESIDDIDAHLHEALAASPSGEAILEEYVEGIEMNGIVIARDGELDPADALRPAAPAGRRLRRRLDPRLPGDGLRRRSSTSRSASRAHTVHALGLRTGIAFPQLIAAPDGRVVVVECAARIPGGQMADLVRFATGVDLVEVQLRHGARRGAAGRASCGRSSSSRSRSASSPRSRGRCRPAR